VRINKKKNYTISNIQFITFSEHIRKMTEKSRAKKVKLIKDGEELCFKSQLKASRFLELSVPTFNKAIKRNALIKGWKPILV
jgi:hypothetical protein